MVERIRNIFNKEFSHLHQAAYLLGGFALLSQILALARDRLLAHFFGAGATLDVYYAAFRIPDFLYIGIASFVSITVLVPFLAHRIDEHSEQGTTRAKQFIQSVFNTFFLLIVVVAGVTYVLVPSLASVVAPGFDPEQRELYITLTRILLLSPILLGLSSLFGSVTQIYRKFFVYASAPLLYNLGIIGGIVFLQPTMGIVGVVYGVIIGALLHLAIQIPIVYTHGLLPGFSLRVAWQDVKNVVLLSLPRTITLSAHQLALLVLIGIASLLHDGSISVFNFSFNLQSVPLSIIGVSYSVAAFPTLARLFSKGEQKQFFTHIASAARHIIFWATPAIVLFIVLRAQIVRSILGSGAFDWEATRLVAASLALFVISLLAHSFMLLFVRAYYAAGKTKLPLLINVCSALFTIGSAYVLLSLYESVPMFRYFFESLLRIEGIPGTEVIVLPLAYTLGMLINGILLFVSFKYSFRKFTLSFKKSFMQIFSASVIMGFVSYEVLVLLSSPLDLNTFIGIFAQGAVAGVVGIVAGIAVLWIMGNTEIREVKRVLNRRIKRRRGAPAIAPDQEEL